MFMALVIARSLPQPRPWRVPVSLLFIACLAGVVIPVAATHTQTTTNGGTTLRAQFAHGGDNPWWVEGEVRGLDGDSAFIVFAQVEGSSTWHYMQFAANTYERQQQGWSKFQPDQAFQVPTGKRVMFRADMTDGATGDTGSVFSCWFTHPAGAEQCGSTSSPTTTTTATTTSSTTTTSGTGFAPQFTGFRGNEWWVQANVGTTAHCVAKVDVRSNGGAWMPLKKQSWGPTAWAGSYHFPQGSILQMRATACDGQTDLSSCRQWIPPSGQDAQIVNCPGTQPPRFDATFSGVKGNNWWVQASVAGNEPIASVVARVDCAPQWRPLTKQSYGWSASFHIPSGAKVDFMATSADGDVDASGGYTWTAATPTTGCALGAWPREGSHAQYQMSSGVCGGGECFNAYGVLELRYSGNKWTGVCTGRDEHWHTDGQVDEVRWSARLDGVAPSFANPATQVGAAVAQRDFEVHYGALACSAVTGPTLTNQYQEDYSTAMPDGKGGYRVVRAWVATRDMPEENAYDMRYDVKSGMVLQAADYPRRSAQGSSWMVLGGTDAPLAEKVVA